MSKTDLSNLYIKDRVKVTLDGRSFEATIDIHPLADVCVVPDGGMPMQLRKDDDKELELIAEGPHHKYGKPLSEIL